MKTSFKLLLPLCAFGLAVAPFARAADEAPSLQVPVPAAPDAGGSSTQAEKGKGNRPMRGGPMMENLKEMKEKLGLTDEQDKQVNGILKSHLEDFKAARTARDRTKMAELMKQQRSEIRAVLNADQQKTFDEMGPGARGKGKGKGKAKKDV